MYLKFLTLGLIFLTLGDLKAQESRGCFQDFLDGLVSPDGFNLCLEEEKIKEQKRKEFFEKQGFIDKPFRNTETHPEASMDAPKNINIPWGMPKGSVPSGKYKKLSWSHPLFVYGSPYGKSNNTFRQDLYFNELKKNNTKRSIYLLRRSVRKNIGELDLTRFSSGIYQPKYEGRYYEFDCSNLIFRSGRTLLFSYSDSEDDMGFIEDGDAKTLQSDPNQKRVKIEGKHYFALGGDRDISKWKSTEEFTYGRFRLNKVCQM